MDKNNIKIWMNQKGVSFLMDVGIKQGQTVLDFGCGEGFYSIPAAKLVGKEGKVYSVDRDPNVLSTLIKQINEIGIQNIIPIELKDDSELNIKSKSVDAVLLYDVLHYLNASERKKLYGTIHNLLRENGLLSIYPKHNKHDWPLWHLSNMDLSEIIKEVEQEQYNFEGKSLVDLIHDGNWDKGYILRFRKNDIT